VCKTLSIRGKTNEKQLANLIDAIRKLFRLIDVPLTLQGLGISREELTKNMSKLVSDSIADPTIYGSPRWINEEQCEKLFWYAFEGKDIDF
jgi:alcohol dehydrogenase class IV